MKPQSALLTALAGRHRHAHLLAFQAGTTWHYLTDAGVDVRVNGQTYVAGYIDEIGDIEQTSTPRLNEIRPRLDASDQVFVEVFLAKQWMNRPLKVSQVVWSESGELAGTITLFDGLMSGVDIAKDGITLSVTSVWADFDKVAGIKTNVASQQRHYPECTAFRWSAHAGLEHPWGRPGSNPPLGDLAVNNGGSGGGSGGPRPDPEAP